MKSAQQAIVLRGPAVEETERGALALAAPYWGEIRRVTAGLVAPRIDDGGVELRLVRAITLFRFGPARTTARPGWIECRFAILGGLLAKEERGWLTFTQRTTEPPRLEVVVEDYVPRLSSQRERRSLRRFVYREVQERAHRAIGRRYLERMARRAG
jgi:hypothetical protein